MLPSMPTSGSPTIAEALTAARDRLIAAGIEDAQIEAEVLLRHALSKPDDRVSRAQLYVRLPDAIDADVSSRFERYLQRRLAREPSAYITQNREFFGYDFLVTPDVL